MELPQRESERHPKRFFPPRRVFCQNAGRFPRPGVFSVKTRGVFLVPACFLLKRGAVFSTRCVFRQNASRFPRHEVFSAKMRGGLSAAVISRASLKLRRQYNDRILASVPLCQCAALIRLCFASSCKISKVLSIYRRDLPETFSAISSSQFSQVLVILP